MTAVFDLISPELLGLAALLAFAAGAVKGAVGFAMPTIMISGLAAFLSAELALAALILPTLVANGMQALRQGLAAAVESIRRFRVFLMVGFVFLITSAQLVVLLPERVLFLLIGGPIALFVSVQLVGWQPRIPPVARTATEAVVGALAGFIGGLSGVWGPPTVAYLTAIETPKLEQIRVQGVIYGLGALALFSAHLYSGVLRAETLPLSLAMLPPALLGVLIGWMIQDRLDQAAFRKATLIVLFIAGLNLIRRGLLG
jgi:uncharacterized membrane protein YfcA